MKGLFFGLLLLFIQKALSDIAIGGYVAGSEVAIVHHDMGDTKGMVEIGFEISNEGKYYFITLQSGFAQLESDNCYTGNVGLGPRYAIKDNIIAVNLKFGLSYFGYVKETMYLPPTVKDEFVHTFPLHFGIESVIFNCFAVLIKGYYDSAILWKFQIGYRPFRF